MVLIKNCVGILYSIITVACSRKHHYYIIENMSDIDSLDGITDDIDIDNLKSENIDDILDACVEDYVQMNKSVASVKKIANDNEWMKCTKHVPSTMRDRWNRCINEIPQDVEKSKFRNSYPYLNFDDEVVHNAFNKGFKDTIINTCSKCGINESKSKFIYSNLDGDSNLKKAILIQILRDVKHDILNDPNFEPSKFPNLDSALTKI